MAMAVGGPAGTIANINMTPMIDVLLVLIIIFMVITPLTPLVNIGVMTMKMISSTSITSTMGVTLISATGGGDVCFIINDISNLQLSHQPSDSPQYRAHCTNKAELLSGGYLAQYSV